MSYRGISSVGRLGVATVVAIALALLWLPSTASAADGAISGKVTLTGGAPLEGATVCAETEGEAFDFECALTVADGTYKITGLTPAKYLVFFEAGDSSPYLISQYYNGVRSWQDAVEVPVNSGATTPGIDAALAEGGVIGGRVVAGKTLRPIADVEVCSWSEPGGEFDGCAYTASDGSYEILGVVSGFHEVEFSTYQAFETQITRGVGVLPGQRNPNVNAALLAGSISGHVYAAADHQPVQGISVCGIWAETGEVGGCTETNSSGAYGFYPVAAGSLKIVFSPEPGEVESRAGVNPDGWQSQFWNSKPTFALADTLNVSPTSAFTGIDGLLVTGLMPPSSNPSAGFTPTPAPIKKPVTCKKGFVKKRVKGKARCVKRHKPRQHHKKHRRHH